MPEVALGVEPARSEAGSRIVRTCSAIWGRRRSTDRGVNARLTSLRSRVCSGGSLLNMTEFHHSHSGPWGARSSPSDRQRGISGRAGTPRPRASRKHVDRSLTGHGERCGLTRLPQRARECPARSRARSGSAPEGCHARRSCRSRPIPPSRMSGPATDLGTPLLDGDRPGDVGDRQHLGSHRGRRGSVPPPDGREHGVATLGVQPVGCARIAGGDDDAHACRRLPFGHAVVRARAPVREVERLIPGPVVELDVPERRGVGVDVDHERLVRGRAPRRHGRT